MTGTLHRTWRIGLFVVIAALYAWVGISAQGIDRILGLLLAALCLLLGWPLRSRTTPR